MKATDEAKIGMAVLAALIFIALAVSFVRPSAFFSQQYTLYAVLSDAQGLRSGAEVLFAGVHAGRVAAVTLDGNRARVTFSVEPEVRIPKDAACNIGKMGFVGAHYIAISGGHAGAGYVSPGDTISEATSPDLMPLINKADRLLKTLETIEDNTSQFKQ